MVSPGSEQLANKILFGIQKCTYNLCTDNKRKRVRGFAGGKKELDRHDIWRSLLAGVVWGGFSGSSTPAGEKCADWGPRFRRGEGAGSRPVRSDRRDAEVAEPGFQFGRKRKVRPLQVRGFDGRLFDGRLQTDSRDGHTSTLLQVRGHFRADRDGSVGAARSGVMKHGERMGRCRLGRANAEGRQTD